MRRLVRSALVLLLAAGLVAPVGASQSEEQKIEAVIAAVIEAYRTGDSATMGRYYAPEVTMVPSDYNPPVQGWSNVEQRYRQSYANLTQVEMVRENTRVERRGNLAWAVYQWRFTGAAGQNAVAAAGHTTLVLEKRRGQWVIVHNHTSAILAPPSPEKTPAPRPSSP